MPIRGGTDARSPVLFAIDEVNALFSKSVYRSPEYELLEAYHLSTPRLALDYLSGRKAFVSGRRRSKRLCFDGQSLTCRPEE
jgi:hypothetical protein